MKGKYKIAVIIVIYLCVFLLIYAFGFYLLRWQSNVNKGQTKVPADEVPEGVELVSLKEVESFSVTPGAVDYGCPKILKNSLLFYGGSGNVQFYSPARNVLVSKGFEYIGDYAKFFVTSTYLVMCSYMPERAYIAEFMDLDKGEIFLKHRLTDGKGEVSCIEILGKNAYIFYGSGYYEVLNIKNDNIFFKNEISGMIFDVSLQKKGEKDVFMVISEINPQMHKIRIVNLDGSSRMMWQGNEAAFNAKIVNGNLLILSGNRDKLILVSFDNGKTIIEKTFPFTIEELTIFNDYVFLYGATYERSEDSSLFLAHYLILGSDFLLVREFSSDEISSSFKFLTSSGLVIYNEKGAIEMLTPSKEIHFSVPSAMKEVLNGNILYVISKSGKYIYLVDTESGTLTKVLVSRTPIWQGEIFDGKVYFFGENYTNSRVDVAIYSE